MNKRTRSTAAFSIVEVVLALGVAGFCLIAILGLLPAGLNANQASVRQTTANGILSSIVADLRATPMTAPPGQATTSTQFKIPIQNNNKTSVLYFAGDGTYSTSAVTNTIFYATVTFSNKGGGPGGGDNDEGSGSNSGSGTASFALVNVAWPYTAAGAAAAAGGSGGGSDNDSGRDSDEGSGGSGGSSAPAPAGIVQTFVALDRNSGSTGGSGD